MVYYDARERERERKKERERERERERELARLKLPRVHEPDIYP